MRLVFTACILTTLCGNAVATDENVTAPRAALLARYAVIFAPRAGFDEEQVVALEADTRSYFYDRAAAGAQSTDQRLPRLHGKLLLYLHFFRINIKARGRQLSDWNYYRLMLDAVRTVDHRYLAITTDASQHYYDLLQDAATAHLWRAVRMHQEYFPFLRWEFCARVEASCPQQQHSTGWETIAQVVAVLNVAIARLNGKIASLNQVASSRLVAGNATTYQQALQHYLRTYEELLAEPYGGLLLMLAEQQHRKMLATPAPFSSYTVARFNLVDVETLRGLFAKIAALFTARIDKLNLLYSNSDRQELLRFLLQYHRPVVAEFLINYPRFFNIINYYLDLANNEYQQRKKRTAAARRNSGFLVAGGVGLSYAALHHFLRFSQGQVLYFTALVGGAAATTYAALQQQALVDVFALQQQVQAMHDSLIMQQSHDLLHFLHQLGQLARVRNDALLQGGMLTVYALFFVHHLRKAWSYRQLKNLGNQASILTAEVDVAYHGFSLNKIGQAIEAHPDLRHLHITERLALIEELFGDDPLFRAWQKKAGTIKNMDDLNNEQIEALWSISRALQHIFEPINSNVAEITARVDATYQATVASDLEKIGFFIHRLFKIDMHGHDIPSVR